MSLLIYTNNRHCVGKISNSNFYSLEAPDINTIEVYTEDGDYIAAITYEKTTKDKLVGEIHLDDKAYKSMIKVTELDIVDNEEYIKEFLNNIYAIFMDTLQFISYCTIYIPLSESNSKVIDSLKHEIIDCSYSPEITNNGENAILLYL